MPDRLTNLLLLGLVLALVATGLVAWALPETRATPLYDAHRALGAALLVLLLWKQGIARASFRRRLRRPRLDRTLIAGSVTGLALGTVLAIGLAWTLGLLSFDTLLGYSPLNVHVFIGVALVPLVAWHLARRWQRRPTLPALLTRRSTLRLLGAGAVSIVLWRAVEAVAALAPGRRFTGSKHAGSFSGNDFPLTIWAFDSVPALDSATWRLEVRGAVDRERSLELAELVRLPRRDLTAVLDCTGGWWSEQIWTGVAVDDVLAACGLRSDAREVAVTSVTGHAWRFRAEELRGALLATQVGGEVLSAGHGYPIRLVVPGRRGFQWIKWVGRIDVS